LFGRVRVFYYVERDNVLIIPGNSSDWIDFAIYSLSNYIASFVSNDTIKTCYPLSDEYFWKWRRGEYEPHWVETNHAEYLFNASPPEFPGALGSFHVKYFIFLNDDLYPKEVHVWVAKFRDEPDYNIVGGGVIMVIIGFLTILAAKYKVKHCKNKFS